MITGHETELWKIADPLRGATDDLASKHAAVDAMFVVASPRDSPLLKLISGERAARDAICAFGNVPCDAAEVPA